MKSQQKKKKKFLLALVNEHVIVDVTDGRRTLLRDDRSI
jgi:hypothetical protein